MNEKEIIAAIADMMDELSTHLDKRFQEIDKRFEQVDKRFQQIDERFEQVDKRFEQMDERFEQMDERFEQMDERFQRMEDKIDKDVTKRIDSLFDGYKLTHDKQFELEREYKTFTQILQIKVDELEFRLSRLEGSRAG
jgi:DNA anti-recombination protein RmuC